MQRKVVLNLLISTKNRKSLSNKSKSLSSNIEFYVLNFSNGKSWYLLISSKRIKSLLYKAHSLCSNIKIYVLRCAIGNGGEFVNKY